MSGRHNERGTEALSRLPTLDLGELRELWCQLYKTGPRRVSVVRCWYVPSPTGCRKSPRVGLA
jgi:hypothetical protein